MAAIVVIHGANGSSAEIEPLSAALRPYGEVFAPNMLGHGGRPVPELITLPELARDVVASLGKQRIERPFVVGYSVGGLVALYLARHFAARFAGACTIAAKIVIDAPTVEHWTYLASVDRLGKPGNPRAAQLERTHAPQDWREVARLNQRFFAELGRAPPLSDAELAAITLPVMLVGSNRDPLVPWAETQRLGKLIPGAKLVMFYGPAHPIAVVPVNPVAKAIDDWMKEVAKR